jgi:Protein of unknown function (DUF4229)
MLIVSGMVLYLCGARGFLLLVLAFLVSGIASYILLSRQRERMAGALNRRLTKATGKVSGKAAELKERLEEGTAAEDDTNDAAQGAEADGLPTRTAP